MSRSSTAAALVRAYGFGHYGKALVWNIAGLLFAYYLTELAGISARMTGLLLGASMLVNALADIVLGARFTRHVRDCADAARFQLLGAAGSSAALVLFALGAFAPTGVRAPWLVASLMAFRLAYALFDVPQNAYLALAARDAELRARMSSIRYTAAGAAVLTIGVAFAPMATAAGDGGRLIFLLLAAGAAVVTVIGARRLPREPARAPQARAVVEARFSALAFAPLSFGALLAAIIATTIAMQFFSKLEAHFSALSAPSGIAPWLLAAAAIGQIASQPLWVRLALRGGEARALGIAAMAWSACALLPLLAPINGATLVLGAFAYRACSSGVSVGMWTALARLSAAPSRTTLRMGVFTCVAKCSEAAALPAIGLLLDHAFYSNGAWSPRQIWLAMMAPATAASLALLLLLLVRSGRPVAAT